eukprot:TRINITY_DN13825_c0_g4_i1.p1 TRINITY_DN13825_c0_g4~~TRINITY_DN13825_c0_g4_i1.p1  ORF type:complete len:281 (+),score=27.18 TRINITY_DN13825_c0_g4_i1:37-879(+)
MSCSWLGSRNADDSSDVDGRDAEQISTHSAFDWLASDDEDDTLGDPTSSLSSPLACPLLASLSASDGLMSSANFHCRCMESSADGSMMSYSTSPVQSEANIHQLRETLHLVQRVLGMNSGYRSLGLSAPLVQKKRAEMERLRDLANRADDAARNARTLLNVQCFKSVLPSEVRGLVVAFLPVPPSPPTNGERHVGSDGGHDCSPRTVYCVDFSLRERIWPKSWFRDTSSKVQRSIAHLEWAEAKWSSIHQQTLDPKPVHVLESSPNHSADDAAFGGSRHR